MKAEDDGEGRAEPGEMWEMQCEARMAVARYCVVSGIYYVCWVVCYVLWLSDCGLAWKKDHARMLYLGWLFFGFFLLLFFLKKKTKRQMQKKQK
jgi:hypothetical protein